MYKKIDWQSIVYVLLCLYENITPKECLNVCQFHLDLILQLPRFGLFRIHLAKRFDDVFDACRNICDLMTQTICHVLGQHELHLKEINIWLQVAESDHRVEMPMRHHLQMVGT